MSSTPLTNTYVHMYLHGASSKIWSLFLLVNKPHACLWIHQDHSNQSKSFSVTFVHVSDPHASQSKCVSWSKVYTYVFYRRMGVGDRLEAVQPSTYWKVKHCHVFIRRNDMAEWDLLACCHSSIGWRQHIITETAHNSDITSISWHDTWLPLTMLSACVNTFKQYTFKTTLCLCTYMSFIQVHTCLLSPCCRKYVCYKQENTATLMRILYKQFTRLRWALWL